MNHVKGQHDQAEGNKNQGGINI